MKKGYFENVDKSRVASRFRTSAATYEQAAIVQKEISRQLIAMLDRFAIRGWARVLEIGCCTGILTELLCRTERIDRLFVNDIVAEFCTYTEKRVAPHVGLVQGIPGDIEQALLPPDLDLVISSSTFQWMADLRELIGKLAASLNGGGHLAFSIFGPETMGEIAALTGRSLRYHANEELLAMIRPNFRLISMHTEHRCLYFPTARAVLRHIKETGVGGLTGKRWTQGKLKEFAQQYSTRFMVDDGLPVTYVSTFVIAEKLGREVRP